MATPFFSIDMGPKEWGAYLQGAVGYDKAESEPEGTLTNILSKRFPDHSVILLPSARLGFYLLLQQAFKPGDEVIFPALGFPLYVKIALQLGLKPKLIDVEPEHLTIDPGKLGNSISEQTKGIVVTHLFGHPAEMNEIKKISSEYGLPLIEDCAQSFDSSYEGTETGTESWAGLISCSLMKVPTTLGGGILLTKDQTLVDNLNLAITKNFEKASQKWALIYHLKGLISILNSYPLLYSCLSHQIFGIIKNRNPTLLRQILYSGMGMSSAPFDPYERPRLARYQERVGKVQFSRTREMTEKRRRNSFILDEKLRGNPRVKVLLEKPGCYWNYQYHVLDLGDRMDRAFNSLFAKGIHVMKEDVWDCTDYGFSDLTVSECNVAQSRNPGLLRIPNNSFLSEERMTKIASAIVAALD